MALNLWKNGGQPTKYNPLPQGWLVNVNVGIGRFVWRFKASSNSGLQLRLSNATNGFQFDGSALNTAYIINLNKTPTLYEIGMTLTSAVNFQFNAWSGGVGGALAGYSDIVIDSVELVQAPLPKLTVNGIDGFNSGKWTLFSSDGQSTLTVNSDTSVTMNCPTGQQTWYIVNNIPVVPGQTYTVSGTFSDLPKTRIRIGKTSDGSLIGSTPSNLSFYTFTVPSGCTAINVQVDNNQQGNYWTGSFTFSNLMLCIGTLQVPYSPKSGDKMVFPIPKKNFIYPDSVNSPTNISRLTSSIDGDYVKLTTTAGATTDNYYELRGDNTIPTYKVFKVVPGKTYTFSGIIKSDGVAAMKLRVVQFDPLSNLYVDIKTTAYTGTTDSLQTNTFTVDQRASFVLLRVQNDTATVGASGWFKNLQLEPMFTSTYSSYAAQMNKLPQRYVPKKNIVPTDANAWEQGSINGSGNFASTTRMRTIIYYPILPNTTYSLSFNSTVYQVNYMLYSGTVLITDSNWVTAPASFTTGATINQLRMIVSRKDSANILPSEIAAVKCQLEQGSTATGFEAYTSIQPPSKRGLNFNGVTDYISVPAQTLNSSFTLESWIYINAFSTGFRSGIITRRFGTGGWNFSVSGNSDVPNKIGVWEAGSANIVSNANFNLKQWYHVVAVLSPNNVKLYVNGVLDNQGSLAWTNDNTNQIFIGNIQSTGIMHNGAMRKAAIYNRALSDNEVLALYNGANMDSVVFNYDFTNSQNIVGNQVIPNAKNLIPSFEDPRWTISAPSASQILGKDSVIFTANNYMYYPITVIPNSNILITCTFGVNTNHRFRIFDSDNVTMLGSATPGVPFFTYNVGNRTQLYVRLETNGTSGNFSYYKPQVYQLTGQEGTISGTPAVLNKPTKRTLYAKR